MNKVVNILMERDGMTKDEAQSVLNNTREMLYDAMEQGNVDEAEDIIYSELGLELDYLLDII